MWVPLRASSRSFDFAQDDNSKGGGCPRQRWRLFQLRHGGYPRVLDGCCCQGGEGFFEGCRILDVARGQGAVDLTV